MNTSEQREELRWRLKPFPELVRLAWPIAVSMLSYSVMTLVDTVFAGRLGATSLGAVGFGGITTFTILCFGLGLVQGGKVLVAQAVGAGRSDKIPGLVGAALLVAAVLGGVFALLGQIVVLALPSLADGSGAVRLAQRYVSIRILGAPIVLAGYAIREVRCALGDSRSPMRTALIANAVHVPLNYTLIFTLGLGVPGAALSTLMAQTLETSLLCFVQRKDGFGTRFWTRQDLVDLWQTGWPLGLERLFNVGAFSILVLLLARAGDSELAAHQIAHQVNLFALLPMMAVAEASAVLAGQAVGANEDDLVKRVARIGMTAGMIYGAFCAFVFIVFGPFIASLLTDDHHVQHIALRLLWVGAAWQAFVAAYLVGSAVLRGTGDVRFSTLTTAINAWVVTPPLALLLAVECGLGAFGGWLALLVEWGIGAVLLWTRVERKSWLRAAIRSRARLAAARGELMALEPART
jgi:MATE family multidrug resistance protein